MKILITGVHGFVGSNLVEALKKEHTIYGLDIISPQKDGVRFTSCRLKCLWLNFFCKFLHFDLVGKNYFTIFAGGKGI